MADLSSPSTHIRDATSLPRLASDSAQSTHFQLLPLPPHPLGLCSLRPLPPALQLLPCRMQRLPHRGQQTTQLTVLTAQRADADLLLMLQSLDLCGGEGEREMLVQGALVQGENNPTAHFPYSSAPPGPRSLRDVSQ